MISAASLFGLLAISVPIAFALIIFALVYIAVTGNWILLASFPQQLFGGLENYGLLALPLFILLGEFMNAGGIGRRLMGVALALLGSIKGGLAYVNIMANMMMASILGSTVAQISIMSRLAVPEMERAGYPKDISVAITAAGGLLAPIFPPSMMFIIYGVIAQISIGDLFIAGILPGLMMLTGFMAVVGILAHRQNFPRSEAMPMLARARAVLDALPAMVIPLVVVGTILGGIATPTESAAVAVFAAAIIGLFVYREMRWSDLLPAFINAGRYSAVVLFLIAAAQAFSWVLTYENLPAMAASWMQSVTSSPIIFLLMLNLLLLALGMVLDPIPAIILLVPVFLPVAIGVYGIDPFHFGVIVCVNLTLGLLTPPVGTGLFTASLMSGVRAERIAWLVTPFFLSVGIVIVLLALFPVLSTGLARVF